MLERAHRERLPAKPRERARVRDALLGENLQGHVAPEGNVLGLVDDTHPATPENADDPIVAGDGRDGAHREEPCRVSAPLILCTLVHLGPPCPGGVQCNIARADLLYEWMNRRCSLVNAAA